MKRHCLLFALSIATVGYAAAAVAQSVGDPAAGKEKAFHCVGCHGIPGYRNAYPDYRVPKLGDQHAEYIIAALKEYQSGARSHPTMRAQAATLSDQDMADLAAYFSSIKN